MKSKKIKGGRVASATVVAVAAAVSGLTASFAHADATWTGTTSQDWNDATNWNPNPPTGTLSVNIATGNTPVVTATNTIVPVDLVIGDSGQSGRLDQSAGTFSLANTSTNGNWMFVGRGGGTGVYNLTGSGSLAVGKLWVGGEVFAENGTGTVTINTTGSVTANSTDDFSTFSQYHASVIVGWGSFPSGPATATLNLVNGTLNANGFGMYVGAWGSTGTLHQTGGTINTVDLNIARWFGTGNMDVANGTVNASGSVFIARSGAPNDNIHGTLTVNGGGVVNSESDFIIAVGGDSSVGSSGTLNVNAGGIVNVGSATKRWMMVNQFDTVQGALNVTGGTVNLNSNTDLRFSAVNGTGTSVVNLNSGAITSWGGNKTGTTSTGVVDLNQAGGATANNTFNLNGGTLTISQVITNNDNGTAAFNFNGGTLQATNDSANFVNLGGANQVANVRNGGAIIDSNGHSVTIVQSLKHSAISGDNATDGGLTKNGAGLLTLTGSHTYNGNTTVNAGTLGVTNGSLASSVNVASGAGFAAAGTATIPALSFAGVGTFGIDLGTSNPANTSILGVTNALTIGGGTVTLNLGHTGPLGSGTYNLATLGSLAGTSGNLVLGTIQGLNASRQTATLNKSSSALTLTVVGSAPLWHGLTSTNWSTNTADTAWNVNGSDSFFINGDDVLFDDTASTTNVNVVGTVLPSSTTFNNPTKNYTVGGSGTIGGAGPFVKLGGGTLTISNANTYSGNTTLNAGQLNINNASAIGTGTLTINGGSLDNTSGSAVTLTTNNPQNWNTDINFVGSNSLNLGTGAVVMGASRTVTVGGTATLTVGGAIGGAGNLTKAGTGTLSMGGANTYSGTTIVDAGTVAVTGGTTGTLAADVQVSPNSGDNGAVNVSGGTLNANRVILGGASSNGSTPGNATLIQSAGTINSQQWFTVGSGNNTTPEPITGTYTMTGGTLNVIGQQMEVGNFNGTTGIVTISGSAAINIENNNFISMGANGGAAGGSITQNGGTVTFYSNNGTTVGGTGILYLGRAGGLTGNFTYSLNGGTLTVPQIARNSGNGVLNLNGGTLMAGADTTTWVQGLSSANVQAGGAKIDDGGHTVTIAQPLVHDSALGSTPDGGLTKSGSGVLTLSSQATYTGATTIHAGTLRVAAPPIPTLIASYTFDGGDVTNHGSGGSSMNGSVNGADLSQPGKFGANSATFGGDGSSIDIASGITDMSGTGNWSVAAWVKTTQAGATIFSKSNGGAWQGGNSIFYLSDGNNPGGAGGKASAVRNGGGWITGSTNINDGAWHFVTYVDSGGIKQIYVDGVAETMSVSNLTNNDVGNIVQLGSTPDTFPADGTQFLNGSIDELKFYSGSLNTTQIQTLMTTNTAGAATPTPVLPVTTAVNIDTTGGVLDLNGNATTIGSLAGVTGASVTLNGGILTTGDATSTTFAGAISGNGGLIKQGTGTFTLSGANTYVGGTTVNAGTLTIAAGGSVTSGSLSTAAGATLNVNGTTPASATVTSSGVVNFNGNASTSTNGARTIGTVAVNAGGLVTIAPSAVAGHPMVLTAAGVSFADATAKFDLTNNELLVPATMAAIRTAVSTGSLKTSTGGLAVGTLAVGGGVIEARATLLGDTNLDGAVDVTDLGNLASSYGATSGALWVQGDTNYNGAVDVTDLGNLASNYGGHLASGPSASGPSASPSAMVASSLASVASSGSAAVPEPASLGLVGLGAIGLLGGRRRRRTRAC